MASISTSPAGEHLQEAEKAFTEKNFQEALRHLTAGFAADVAFEPLYELAVKTLKQMNAREEARLFENALADFENFQPFFALGYHFIDFGRHALALPFLERAHALNPQHADTIYELSLALTSTFQVQRAIEVLESFQGEDDFWIMYRLRYCFLLANQHRHEVGAFIAEMRGVMAEQQEENDTKEMLETSKQKIEELNEMLQRLQQVDRPLPRVRDWHFIQYGAAILSFFMEEDPDPAGGRYVVSWGSLSEIRQIIERLALMLQALERKPDLLVYLPDRDSEILGLAIAQRLQLEAVVANEENMDMQHVLVVAADAAAFDNYPSLSKIRRQQTLFAFSMSWLQSALITPDIIGLLGQCYYLPWQGHSLRFDPESKQVQQLSADERPTDQVAAELINTLPEEKPEEFADILEFYQSKKEYIKGGRRAGNRRMVFQIASPVPGSHFS